MNTSSKMLTDFLTKDKIWKSDASVFIFMLTGLICHRNGRDASFTASPTKIHTSFLKLQLGALLNMSAVQEMPKKHKSPVMAV